MDEYHCHAYPHNSAADFVSKIPLNPDDQHFNVEVEYTNMYVLNARKFRTDCHTTYHKFSNISKDEMMQETTIVSWLSNMGVPRDAHKFVVANMLKCACGMANSDRCRTAILTMCVEVVITRASEDETSDEEEDDDDFEELEIESEDHGLVPAAKSLVEGLEMVEQRESMQGKCAICFEDFVVGVRMPCLHMFHKNCIDDWLRVGNSCPLCRFHLPTATGQGG